MDGVNENALRVKLIEKKKVGSSRRGDDLARGYEGATRHGGEEEQGAGGEEKGRSGEEENCPKGEEGTWRQRNVLCDWVVSLLQQAMPHRMWRKNAHHARHVGMWERGREGLSSR